MHLEIIVILSECIYRYYESRRRVLLDSKPARIQKKFENDRKKNLLRDNEQYVNSLLHASKESLVILCWFCFSFITGVHM